MLCRNMGRPSRAALLLLAPLLGACARHGPDLDERADQWAEVVCERWTECGCPVDDCEAEQRQAFLERWDAPDRVPIADCFDARLELIRGLACDYVQGQPFEWEQAACPITPTFVGLGELCEPAEARETFAGGCEAGLVCDAATRRCLSTVPRPREGDPCLRSGAPDVDDWLCDEGLVCDEAGRCVADDMRERTPPAPLVCDGLLVF